MEIQHKQLQLFMKYFHYIVCVFIQIMEPYYHVSITGSKSYDMIWNL